jgi:predicted  nucleic acid-binding Zn-ribbon protein
MELNATARLDITLGQLLRETEHLKDLCDSQQSRISDLTNEIEGLKARLAEAVAVKKSSGSDL